MIKNYFKVLAIGFLVFAGCTKAERSQVMGFGKDYKISVYSGGEKVREFVSSGKVLTEEKSDGWYFTNKESGKLVRISGTVIVEEN